MPVVLEILRAVEPHVNGLTRFDQLTHANQRRITQQTVAALDRAKLDAARTLANQTLMFGRVAEAAYQCSDELNRVLRDKYSEAGELEATRH
jgi:hypothetical protein